MNLPDAARLVRGTILGTTQGGQTYDVSTSLGRFTVQGLSAGASGHSAVTASTYPVGATVWVLVDVTSPGSHGCLVGATSKPRATNFEAPAGLLVYPRMAGYLGDALESISRKAVNRNTGLKDVVDGELVTHNAVGGAAGVEQFRTFLQGGPMSGVYCYSDDGHTKLVGSRYELITLAEEYEDRAAGLSINSVKARVGYVGEALTNAQPTYLEVAGPAYVGRHRFLTYPQGLNSNLGSRFALFHEYIGQDGAYVVSSASSILFQKLVGIPMPVQLDYATNSCENCNTENAGDYGQEKRVSDTEQDAIVQGTEYADTAAIAADKALVGAMKGTAMADALLLQALQGFQKHPTKWAINTDGLSPYSPSEESGDGSAEDYDPYRLQSTFANGITSSFVAPDGTPYVLGTSAADPTQLRTMPSAIRLQLDPFGGTKTYYLGRAVFGISEDGSIILQGAKGSGIAVTDGSVFIQSNHDVVITAGRSMAVHASRDVGLRASRHMDISTNEGRMMLASAGQATFMGGLDGASGVAIVSKGRSQLNALNGDTRRTGTGIYIQAEDSSVAVKGAHLNFRAVSDGASVPGAGSIHFSMDTDFTWQSAHSETYGVIGSVIAIRGSTFMHSLGAHAYIGSAASVSGSLFYSHMYAAPTQSKYALFASDVIDTACTLSTVDVDFAPCLLFNSTLSPEWLSSYDRGLVNGATFSFPMPDWQVEARNALPEQYVHLNAVTYDVPMAGGLPFPGLQAWTSFAVRGASEAEGVGYTGAQGFLLKGL